jgi:prenyltransferase beta subunit
MTDLRNKLDETSIKWLLEKENPSVRYLTLRDLLDRDENDSELKQAKADIPKSKLMRGILAKQRSGGYWEDSESSYLPKYKSTYWQIMILAQLGMNKTNEKVEKACEFVLKLQLEEGGFSSYTRKRAVSEYEWMRTRTHLKEELQPEPQSWARSLVIEHQYSCLTGNVCAALLRLGYTEDARVRKALDWLVKVQNLDGGWLCPYWKAHVKDTHGCFYGTICPMEAFSEVPESERSSQMEKTIEKGVEFLLMHRLYKADHHGYRVINRQWLKLGFPWFSYNILRGLAAVTKLGYVDDERLTDAVRALIQKRRTDGSWILESTPAGRMQTNIEAVGKPSKWITLNALKVLKRLSETRNGEIKKALSDA